MMELTLQGTCYGAKDFFTVPPRRAGQPDSALSSNCSCDLVTSELLLPATRFPGSIN
jgi:hypothetical protein